MNSIAEVIAGAIPRSWHEAVAVVQEVAQHAVSGTGVPELEDVLLDEEGNLSVGFASESSEDPVVLLSTLLVRLLNGIDCPPPLLHLAGENARVPPAHASLASFTRALAFFERPNRASDLAALGGRLAARRKSLLGASEYAAENDFQTNDTRPGREAEEVKNDVKEEAVEQSLERLKEKVANSPSAPASDARKDGSGGAPAWIRPASAAVVLAGVALLAGAWLGSRGLSPTEGISAAVETAETKLADVLTEGINRLTPVETAAAAPASDGSVGRPDESTPVRSKAPTAPSPRVRPPSRDRPMSQSRPSERLAAAPILSSLVPDADTIAHSAIRSPYEITPLLDFSRVYTASDTGVEPPRLRRPQLPSQPEPDEETGYFDIVVNEQGRVDEVRLISPSRRYYDRMMVAAAKAWVFQPARLHGHAVKFRTRIPIIAPPPM